MKWQRVLNTVQTLFTYSMIFMITGPCQKPIITYPHDLPGTKSLHDYFMV
jgi:hypothetical protein